jgi:two-component system response regulator MtrA
VDEHVLVVEDDASIREVVGISLRRAGLRVSAVGDGGEALARLAGERFDAVVLDLMLPGVDGLEVCRRLRAAGDPIPIVMLTARADTHDVVVGLELGADDYVVKPFAPPELVARVRAALRRARGGEDRRLLRVGPLEVDEAAFRARVAGRELQLTATEFRLLAELARRPGQVFTRELLLDRVWNAHYLGDSRLVDVAVQRLRAKLEDDPSAPRLLHTVRGVGYRLDAA